MEHKLNIPKFQSAHAILIVKGRYILQLRDNKRNIAAAGQWSLFGGKIDNRETPLKTIKREVYEELSIKPLKYTFLWHADYYSQFQEASIRTWFFVSDVAKVWHAHRLKEGKCVRVFRFDQVERLKMPEVFYQALRRFHLQREKGLQTDEDRSCGLVSSQ